MKSFVRLTSASALIFLMLISNLGQLSVTSASTSSSIPASFFGITIDTSVTSWPVTLPFGTVGKTAAGGPQGGTFDTYWLGLEPSNGTFDWTPLDNLIAAARSAGIASVMYTLYETPTWASSNPTQSCFATQKFGILGCAAPPRYISDWDTFVTRLVTRYKGQIQYYEVWNEPNVSTEYSGNITEMVTLAQHAYGIIKSIDPSALVLAPGISVGGIATYTTGCSPSLCWLAEYLQAGGGQYADGVDFHGKTCVAANSVCSRLGIACPSYAEIEQCQGSSVIAQIDDVRSLMSAYEISGKFVVDSEGGYSEDIGKNNLWGTADQQTATVSRFFIVRASEDLKVAVWFSWFPSGFSVNGQSLSGLGTSTASSEISQAYRQTYDWLVGASFTSPCSLSNGLWTCSITSPQGHQELILWGDTNSSVASYTPPSQYIQYQDLAGRIRAISPGSSIGVNEKPILLGSTTFTTSNNSTTSPSSSTSSSSTILPARETSQNNPLYIDIGVVVVVVAAAAVFALRRRR